MDLPQCEATAAGGGRCNRVGRPLCALHSGEADARRRRYAERARDPRMLRQATRWDRREKPPERP